MKKNHLEKLLNLNITKLTNQTYSIGKYDLPYIPCPDVCIDYLALYSHIGQYNQTPNTTVCFFQYDVVFDGLCGLFNAIYYNDEELLNYYKSRFQNVQYFIAPDYSMCGDISCIENYYRVFKTRIVSLWFTLELGKLVIPNITYANENYFDCMLDGLEQTEVVCISIKGSMREPLQKDLLKKCIEKTTDELHNLKKIIVYSVCSDDNLVYATFDYAIKKGINVVIPNNILRNQNVQRRATHG